MKPRALLLLAAFAVSASAAAPAFAEFTGAPDTELARAERMSISELYAYSGTPEKKVDPTGDFVLYTRAMRSLDIFGDILRGKRGMENPKDHFDPGEPREPECWPCRNKDATQPLDLSKTVGLDEQEIAELMAELENKALTIQGRENPVKRHGFSDMFAQIIDEERRNGIEPSAGTPHAWSKEFLDEHGRSPVAQFSKLLVGLAYGRTWMLMPTGNETSLRDWILEQPDDSITVPELFRKSYRLNGGDVYSAILTIENVLARHWRYPNREGLPQTRKLSNIVNGHNFDQDRFGTWYHFFGMMLYGYVKGGFKAGMVGRIEAMGSNILSDSDKTQKQHLNKIGGPIGSDLRSYVAKKKYETFKPDSRYLEASHYLNKAEDFRDRIKVAPDKSVKGRLPFPWRAPDEPKPEPVIYVSTPKKLTGCKVELMFDDGFGLHSSNLETFEGVNFTPGEEHRFDIREYSEIRKVRGFISGCLENAKQTVFELK